MTIETYPEMDAKITEILRWDDSNSLMLYAAQRIEELEAEVEWWRREFQDERVRRDEWEKMYNLAIASPAPDTLPCGHPRSKEENWRIGATLDRLISNIPAACERLRERGLYNLAGQLQRDCDSLTYWQEHGGLVGATDGRT